jgi:hypothetical protein
MPTGRSASSVQKRTRCRISDRDGIPSFRISFFTLCCHRCRMRGVRVISQGATKSVCKPLTNVLADTTRYLSSGTGNHDRRILCS